MSKFDNDVRATVRATLAGFFGAFLFFSAMMLSGFRTTAITSGSIPGLTFSGGNVTVTGNLTVQGNATVASGQTLTVDTIKPNTSQSLVIQDQGGTTGITVADTFVGIHSTSSGSERFRAANSGLGMIGGAVVYTDLPIAASLTFTGSDTFPTGAAGKHHFSGSSGSGTCAANSAFYHDGTSWTLVDDGSTCTP